METISSNHFSHDLQVLDALEFLEHNDGVAYAHLMNMFPEMYNVALDGSWFDHSLMGVEADYSSWLCDEIEACSNIMWHDGEPYNISEEDYTHDADEFFDGFILQDDDVADVSEWQLTS